MNAKRLTGLVRSVPVIVGAIVCLTTFISNAQTPAQDNARVEADKKALEEARAVVKADMMQLAADQAAKEWGAVQIDTAKLDADKKIENAAEEKLKADLQQLDSDNARFSGVPTAPAPAVQPAAVSTIPGTSITPAAVPAAPAAPATAPAGTTPAPAPAADTTGR